MFLTQVILKGFRAYKDATFDLPREGVQLIAGANNAGKSTLLSALDVLAGKDQMPPSTWHEAGIPPLVTGRFQLSETDRESIVPPNYPGGLVPDWLEWEIAAAHDGAPFLASFGGSWDGADEAYVLVRVAPRLQSVHHFELFMRHWPTRLAELTRGPALSPIAPVRPNTGLQVAPEITSIPNQHLDKWRASYFHFPPLRPGTQRSSQLRQATDLLPTGENLPAILLDLQNNRPHLWQELRNLMTRVVPDVGLLALKSKNTDIEVVFDDPHNADVRLNLKDLGVGVEQLLLMLVVGIAMPQTKVIAAEEPETGLHPSAQRALVGLLHSWAKDRLFIVTTHSPVLLDTEHGTPSVLAVSRAGRESTVNPVQRTFHELLGSLGVRLSDVLSADRILIVEGISDMNIIEVWLPGLRNDPRVAVIDGEGGRSARYAQKFGAWLSQTDRIPRRLLYLRDRDELPKEELQLLADNPNVYVLPHREIENFFLDSQALAIFLNSTGKGLHLTSDEIEQDLRKAADSLIDLVVMKTVCHSLDIVRLADDELRRKLSETSITVDTFVSAVCLRIPDPNSIEASIRRAWKDAREFIDATWATEWRSIAPGEEVLHRIFKTYLGNLGFNVCCVCGL